eukprot:CAMPEP_0119120540 /NCGR_PEP_ID=MMETSP1310-20130426/1532_1 /TAXON_ID=464262 /ORGANISM="Genus nov. species nov., Strain RCC2339" /LENGTH=193 /DNA_ID=CAMNT_0007110021 /DNA_START=44 /DNA_END=625 /DNA_ORIENTATION=+
MGEVQISTLAYVKALLHAYKRSTASVTGVVVGKLGKDGCRMEVEDIFPLTHGSFLYPEVEMALSIIRLLCAKKQQVVLGFYHGNEARSDKSIPALLGTLGAQLEEKCGSSLLLVMNNAQLAAGQMAFDGYFIEKGKDGPVEKSVTVRFASGDTSQVLANCIKGGAADVLVDYSDHLDDLTLDWTNASFQLHAS